MKCATCDQEVCSHLGNLKREYFVLPEPEVVPTPPACALTNPDTGEPYVAPQPRVFEAPAAGNKVVTREVYGPKGDPGRDGKDSTVPGPQGIPGRDGKDADISEVVALSRKLVSDELTKFKIELTSTIKDIALANLIPGPAGRPGRDGVDGKSIVGPAGRDGVDGKSIIGPPGKDGVDGKSIVGPCGEKVIRSSDLPVVTAQIQLYQVLVVQPETSMQL